MPIHAAPLERVFEHGPTTLPDPDPSLSPEEVLNLYATQYPEMTSGRWEGPALDGGKQVFTFKRAVGTKG